jgi:putative transcriptional regulator
MASRHKIVAGLEDAISYARGEKTKGNSKRFNVPENVDVKAIRSRLGLTQAEFALRFGFSIGALRHWEQGQRYPEGPARVLLSVIARNPEVVEEAMTAFPDRKAEAV